MDMAARTETMAYHQGYYAAHELFEAGSWLQEPDEELPEIINYLASLPVCRVLDIGCGVGRNAIPIAQAINTRGSVVDCVDILPLAISKLIENARRYGVVERIKPNCADMDDLAIEQDAYDAIIAISTLEHSASLESIRNSLKRIMTGTRYGGFNRLTFSTNRSISDRETGDSIQTKVETPMTEDEVMDMLRYCYEGWKTERLSTIPYCEYLELNGRQVLWTCKEVSFLARRI